MKQIKKFMPTTKACRKKGLTIVEILIVLAIIAILSNWMVLSIKGFQNEARQSQVKADLKTLQVALEAYYKNNSTYPDPANYQSLLVNASPRILESNLVDPFVTQVSSTYAFSLSSNRAYYVLYSVGLSMNGSVQINDEGKITASGSPIWVSNSSNI